MMPLKDCNVKVYSSVESQDVERGIKASKKNKVIAEKEGYKTCEFNTSGTFQPWFLGNILLGGLIGMAIDMGTGAVSSIQEEHIKMILYEDKPCDIYIRERYGEAADKWIKYGEKEKKQPENQ